MLFKPVSINFCNYKINDYRKDSKSYLEELNNGKTDYHKMVLTTKIFLVAADVKVLYSIT